MINDDTNPSCFLLSNPSVLELCQCESTAFTDFAVVSHGLATNGGAEESERSNSQSSGFGFSGVTSAELSSWLIEPGADPALPVFPEVVVVEDLRFNPRVSERMVQI